MVALNGIVTFLDRELKVSTISDYPGALNGLQLTNHGQVERIIAAVDATLPVIEAAAEGGPGLLVVHHGMFWQGAQPVTGAFYRKLKIAMDAGLAIYSSHLPLDIHPEWGNNILLAKAIGLINPEPFHESKGQAMGIRGEWKGTRNDLVAVLGEVLNGKIHLCPGGSERVSSIGIITGGAGSEVAKIAATGVDAFVTGEGPHWSYTLAEELNINVMYGGHYATETFGVQEVSRILAAEFKLPWTFIDRPTGL
ncbi:MAG: Nif3-like dinuclear metal center hexameric protein [Gloeobacteraceae cyanobacterium ES-bin-144]|nr:Nif3-like dinuclear metal center hexameric protein [Verrucomicrobiales bacterium]